VIKSTHDILDRHAIYILNGQPLKTIKDDSNPPSWRINGEGMGYEGMLINVFERRDHRILSVVLRPIGENLRQVSHSTTTSCFAFVIVYSW
jgi:hypothetical protein